jgi:peptidoglycan/xylan/chitin deacetylase (PgdA/CDA1 family)
MPLLRSSLTSLAFGLLTGACARGDAADSARPGAATPAPATAAASGGDVAPAAAVPATEPGAAAATAEPTAADPTRGPNEYGRIPVLEYHLIVPQETNEFTRTPERLRQDLAELHRRGYRPVNMTDVLDKKIQNLPRGISPVVLVFDDASPSQFRYLERGGKLVIDPTSAVGHPRGLRRQHRDWPRKACSACCRRRRSGRSFFGDKGIEGQKTEWRFPKLQFLHKQGYELCNHTLYHARLDRAGEKVQEFIARGDMAIDSAVPGYKVRTFACRSACGRRTARSPGPAAWTDPKSGRRRATSTTRCSRCRAIPTRARTIPTSSRTASTGRSCSGTRSRRRSTGSTSRGRAAAT